MEKIPHFEYESSSSTNKFVGAIKLDGKEIHHIQNMYEFYQYFGYTKSDAKEGVLPDEFIWMEYVNNHAADFTPCAQMHIIRYLEAHSDKFKEQYASQYKKWFDGHAKIRLQKGVVCASCKMNPYCEDVKPKES